MNKLDQPISIIGVLFSLSIAFWGQRMVTYIKEEMPRPGYVITDTVLSKLQQYKWKEVNLTDKEAKGYLEEIKNTLKGKPFLSGEKFEEALKGAEKKSRETAKPSKSEKARGEPTAEASATTTVEEAKGEQTTNVDPWEDGRKVIKRGAEGAWIWPKTNLPASRYDVVLSLLLILAGLGFLADIACVMWWYARYIYVIHPAPTLPTHFLDFGICAAFNLAAGAWTDPEVFLTATVAGAGLLLGRFRLLYGSPEASGTDKYILNSAVQWMRNAVIFSLLGLFAGAALVLLYGFIEPEMYRRSFHPVLLITLSAIGIWLTKKFARRIAKSADMHENRDRHFQPMQLHWPKDLEDDGDSRQRIAERARSGLDKFRNMFSTDGVQHDRLISRVHAEADLRVQSYILAIPSWKRGDRKKVKVGMGKKNGSTRGEVKDTEVEWKAFIAGLAHWLDDLLDGREEVRAYREVSAWLGTLSSLDLRDNRSMFERLYRSAVIDHTDPNFYDRLVESMESSVGLLDNLPYLYFGLNRVAVGSALFSPRLPYKARKEMLRSHSTMLGHLITSQDTGTKPKWIQDLTNLLADMQAREDGLGHYLLGLTTKTAQEMAMASEGQPVNFALSVLYSLLYAPLLYFHDIEEEVKCREMAPLETFDVNYEAIVPWMQKTQKLIDDAPADDRHDSRLLQVKMAFCCFELHLPQVARKELVKIYLGEEEATRRQQPVLPDVS